MELVFYLSGGVAIVATLMMLTRLNAVHALLYLIASLLAVAVVFFTLGAPFAAALEVIIYAGAIMVLFVFVVMLLNLGEAAILTERAWLQPGIWIGPSILATILIAEFIFLVVPGVGPNHTVTSIGPEEVGAGLFGPYMLGVELASMLLLAGLVGAYHLGRRMHSRTGLLACPARADRPGGMSHRAGASEPGGAGGFACPGQAQSACPTRESE